MINGLLIKGLNSGKIEIQKYNETSLTIEQK